MSHNIVARRTAVGLWLMGLDLERYEGAFRENGIDFRDLPDLTNDDLEELGIPLGPRKRLLEAPVRPGDR
jgi:SAM domain (Sterile alpha motif)